MNYLGHIYFSGNRQELIQPNLYGDFFKGSHFEEVLPIIAEGIKLHREIDSYIDNHPSVKNLVTIVRADLPKVAPIAIDLYFDHLLAKNWNQFHPEPLLPYLATIYEQFELNNDAYSAAFQHFLKNLIEYNWIQYYSSLEGLDKLCNGVSRKLSFDNALVNGKNCYLLHEKAIESAFHEYMQDADEHFLTKNPRIMS